MYKFWPVVRFSTQIRKMWLSSGIGSLFLISTTKENAPKFQEEL
jgi:hypothetical protein